jgi:CheY-like chemotaxis protein
MPFRIGKNQTKQEILPEHEEIEALNFSHVAVLIVEDNKVNQLLLKNMLKKFGFDNLDTAENGRIALNRLHEKNYDLVLMDIQMPEMDGYEITNEIRTRLRKEMRKVPVIAITADASDKEKAKAKEAGMNDYIVKPYTPEELYFTILKFVSQADSASTETKKDNAKILTRFREAGMNLEFLDKFTGGDQELTIQLIEIFMKQVPEAIHKLEHAISRHDWKETHAVSHKVKSSIAIFELNELKKLITNIEEYSRDKEHIDEIAPAFSAFREGARIAMRNLEAELKKLKQMSL